MKKLIISDVDGTLLTSNSEVSTTTKLKLFDLMANGHPFAIATGRMHAAGKIITKQLDYDGYLISCNGAVVKHLKTGEVIHAKAIAPDSLRKAIEVCRQYDVYFHLYDNDNIYGNRLAYLSKRYKDKMASLPEAYRFNVEKAENFEAILKKPIYKMGVYHEDKAVFTSLKEAINALGLFETSQSMAMSFDINGRGVNKAVGIEALRKYFGISVKDVIAFGDNENDIEMIKYAGIGVAMGNATDSLKAVADVVTVDNDSDGIAVALEKLRL